MRLGPMYENLASLSVGRPESGHAISIPSGRGLDPPVSRTTRRLSARLCLLPRTKAVLSFLYLERASAPDGPINRIDKSLQGTQVE